VAEVLPVSDATGFESAVDASDGDSAPVGDPDPDLAGEASDVPLGDDAVEVGFPGADDGADVGVPEVGVPDGCRVGDEDGVGDVGEPVGGLVGDLVGDAVGDFVAVGLADGLAEGLGDGLGDGLGVGLGEDPPNAGGATPGGPWFAPCHANATEPPAGTVREPAPSEE